MYIQYNRYLLVTCNSRGIGILQNGRLRRVTIFFSVFFLMFFRYEIQVSEIDVCQINSINQIMQF